MAKKEGYEDVRKLVIRELEKCCEIRLTKVDRPRWLRDGSGKNWVVLVGKGNFHAIPEAVIKHEKQQDSTDVGVVCVALQKEKDAVIEVFRGPMNQFVKSIEKRNISLASLSDGVGPDARDDDGATPLHYAAREGSLGAIRALSLMLAPTAMYETTTASRSGILPNNKATPKLWPCWNSVR